MTWLAIRALLGRVPGWVFALAAVLAWGSWQHHRATAAGERAVKAEQALSAMRLAAAEVTKNELAQTLARTVGAVNEAKVSTAAAVADSASYADALRRLRARAAGGGCPAPAASAGSSAAGSAPDLCADVLGRFGEAAGLVARESDKRRTAGIACERISGPVK